MYLKSARSLVTVSLLNISTIGLEMDEDLTVEEKDNLTSAWEYLEAVRKSLSARLGAADEAEWFNDDNLEAFNDRLR